MRAVEFVFANPDSTDSFWMQNLRLYVCERCEHGATCRRGAEMPVISPLSRYIMRWHAEQKTVAGYPYPGSWEDQPVWWLDLMSTCAAAHNRLERQKLESK